VGIIARLFGAKTEITLKPVEHAVIVRFRYGGMPDLGPLFALERELKSTILWARAGKYDGKEVAGDGSNGTLYMYGPDADRLFGAIQPILEACSFMKGAVVRLRYGPPADGIPERTVQLAS
jgi:hypothetical protein